MAVGEIMEILGLCLAVAFLVLDSFRKKCLMEGLDDIGITLKKAKNIEEFENSRNHQRPWL